MLFSLEQVMLDGFRPPLCPGHVIFSSFGNDSIALIWWAHTHGVEDVVVAFSDTGWAAAWWLERVGRARAWVESLGFTFVHIPSRGMVDLIHWKKAWPRNGIQFCTLHLKIIPAREWLARHDPEGEATCMVGVRRAESRARRVWPEWQEESDNHGGRSLWAPLVTYSDEERDELLAAAGWAPLPHRSMECYPCINSSRMDLRQLTPERVSYIEALEQGMGHTSNGHLRTMFRPKKFMGAVGIREVHRWAEAERGQYRRLKLAEPALGPGGGCDSGMCAL